MVKPVAILIGSPSDRVRIKAVITTLSDSGVPYDIYVASAHRTPHLVTEFCVGRSHSYGAIVAAAGMAAALPGSVAAQTDVPVIGLPLAVGPASIAGQDALYSMTQMPPGIPVLTVGIDGCVNAALAAMQIAGHLEAFNKYRADRASKYPATLSEIESSI